MINYTLDLNNIPRPTAPATKSDAEIEQELTKEALEDFAEQMSTRSDAAQKRYFSKRGIKDIYGN